jgi:hypothetical protein
LTAQTPSYQTILELDRKVREKVLPPHLDDPDFDDISSPIKFMWRHVFHTLRSICLTYIHRSFFARALLDHPKNPLLSPYAPSFLSAYRCSSVIIKKAVRFINRLPDLSMRWTLLWTHLFSAAVCFTNVHPSPLLVLTAKTFAAYRRFHRNSGSNFHHGT